MITVVTLCIFRFMVNTHVFRFIPYSNPFLSSLSWQTDAILKKSFKTTTKNKQKKSYSTFLFYKALFFFSWCQCSTRAILLFHPLFLSLPSYDVHLLAKDWCYELHNWLRCWIDGATETTVVLCSNGAMLYMSNDESGKVSGHLGIYCYLF